MLNITGPIVSPLQELKISVSLKAQTLISLTFPTYTKSVLALTHRFFFFLTGTLLHSSIPPS